MSTFDGRIKEYPELAIDNFTPNNYSQFFLLSHVHKGNTKKSHLRSHAIVTNS